MRKLTGTRNIFINIAVAYVLTFIFVTLTAVTVNILWYLN